MSFKHLESEEPQAIKDARANGAALVKSNLIDIPRPSKIQSVIEDIRKKIAKNELARLSPNQK